MSIEKIKECFFGYLSNKNSDIACYGIGVMSDKDKAKLALALLNSIPHTIGRTVNNSDVERAKIAVQAFLTSHD